MIECMSAAQSVLVFSDTHFTSKVDRPRLDVLKQLIQQHDQVVINGDFFDGYLVTFDDFVRSGWSELFPLLAKKTVYIYGNHDKKEYSDQRVRLFSHSQTTHHTIPDAGVEVRIEHGDRIAPSFDSMLPGVAQRASSLYPWWLLVEQDVARVVPPVGWALSFKRRLNNWRIARSARRLPADQVLLTGHSHIPYRSDRYYNPGSFSRRLARYATIADTGIAIHAQPL